MNIKIKLFSSNNKINTLNCSRKGEKSHSDGSAGNYKKNEIQVFIKKVLYVST